MELLRSIGLDSVSARKLGVWKSKLQKGPDKTRGRGRPPGSGDFVCLAATKKATTESVEMLAEAELLANVTSKLSSAAAPYRGDGTLEGVPLSGVESSIEGALESMIIVSKVSKGLKGTMVGRLKAAVAVARTGSEELQRRLSTLEREVMEAGPSNAAMKALHQRAVMTEAVAHNLQRRLTEEKEWRTAAEERNNRPPPHSPQTATEVTMRDTEGRGRSHSPSPSHRDPRRGLPWP